MLPIMGKPLLAYTLNYLRTYGFDQIAINLHYKAQQIVDYFGDGSAFKIGIEYFYEESLLGTAGTVKNLGRFFAGSDDFLVIYGDLLIDQDLTALLSVHRQKRAYATLLLHERRNSNSLVHMDSESRITGFVERPTDEERQNAPYAWVNSGVQVLSSEVIAHIPDKQPADLPKDVYVRLVERQHIYGVPLSGYRCAIDSPERYAEACRAVEDKRYNVIG